ncbi:MULTISPECIES: hypothetical protein [unclassified Nocardioides]|uniref:hypothetical protein n=1 Tax=unclassified Nocardioides TaxID=2615069 RepID=UPI00070390C7|nr:MULTISPECIES: hypothetical protein [unclassified Nocardioides]KQP66688.1 hypothetical protein ASF47_02745 [Nocardioides sp. Leaf285]KQQ41602.1 hypothetical protein ASF50_11585 [Nocardioides sp. Leaf307]
MTADARTDRLAHADLASPVDMRRDCVEVGRNLGLADALDRVGTPAPGLTYDRYPTDLPKREIAISEAAQRLANALHLHLD